MKLKAFSILLFSLVTFYINGASNAKIKLIDIDLKTPIKGVEVLTIDGDIVGKTNSEGIISLDNLNENKTYTLLFINELYGITEKEVVVKNNKINIIELKSLVIELEPIDLIIKKEELFNLKKLKSVEGTHIYDGKKTEVIVLDKEIANKSTNNARQVYSKVAGLNIYDADDGGLQLNIGGRGLDPNRSANFNTRQNDYDISADVLGYPDNYYTPPTEAISEIQVIRGAASLQYGTQFGGLINFKLKKPSKKLVETITRNTLASYGTYTNFTSVGGTKNKLSYYAYYNGKKGDGFRPNSGYKAHNTFAHLGYKFNKKTNISAEYTYFHYLAQQAGGLSDVQFLEDFDQSNRTRNWFSVNWNLFNIKLNHNFSEKTKATLSLFALNASRNAIGFRTIPIVSFENNNLFGDNDDQDSEGNFDFERDLLVGKFKNYGAEARVLHKYKLTKEHSHLLLGGKLYRANNSLQQGPGSNGTDADFNFKTDEHPLYPFQNKFTYPNLNLSFFGENIFKITKTFSITPGFRYEYIKTESNGEYISTSNLVGDNPKAVFIADNQKLERNFLLMGVGLSFKPKTYFESYFNFSQNYRSVTFIDIQTVTPSFVIDPDIKDETGYTIDLGLRGVVTKVLSYDLGIFSILYDNRIGQYFASLPPYRGKWVRSNIGQASIYGFESLLQWNVKETFFQKSKKIKLGVFTNLALTTSEYTSENQANIKGNEVEFIPAVNLKTGLSAGYKTFAASIQYSYISEQFTDATNSEYNPKNFNRVDGAIPSYDIVDLSTRFKINKIFTLETGVNNLLDKIYFTRRATGYPGPGIIPSSPRSYYFTLEIKLSKEQNINK